MDRGDPEYPNKLEILPDPPSQLYLRGSIPSGPMVAIVGSRNVELGTRRFVSRLAAELVAHGVAVVSGGALGVDTAAHEGALHGGGVTVSVLGSGFGYPYPEANRDLFDKISQSGALLTEFHPEQPPTRWTFPKRNRLVAALSNAVVVAGAGPRSGALITVSIAQKLGIPIGAVPGPADETRNRGSNQLLRQGAQMIENAYDIISLLQEVPTAQQLSLQGVLGETQRGVSPTTFSDAEEKILDILTIRSVHIDEIIASTGLEPGDVNAAILSLEIAGFVADQGGKNFVKVG